MKENLIRMIGEAARSAHAAGALPSPDVPEVGLESPKLESHGDFSTNVAMTMARSQKMAPRKIADILLAHLEDPEGMVDRTEVAGPGFINFFLTPVVWRTVVEQVFAAGDRFGSSIVGIDEPVQVEFVSANPTGPLHVGHGRGAAVGDATAAILAFCGHPVEREYYINDSGRQIRTLGRSVYLRYRELFDLPIEFPEECYQGDYIVDIARQVQQDHGRALMDQEEDDAVMTCARFAADTILAGIRKDLADFGVVFDRWFSEQTLYDDNRVMATLERLRADGLVYDADGAVWFRSTDFGDEKDRVVVRSNGQTTYFASDIAYHHDKYQRGFHHVIDVWGADHHGYIPRVTAAVAATGTDPDRFRVILVKLVNLMRSGTQVAMSTRAGKFETLADVVAEVGADAARFIFLTRSTDSPLDFDLDLAKKKSNDNPVFYVQYVHARISSIHTKAEAQGITVNAAPETADLIPLEAPEEIALMRMLARFPEVVLFAGRLREPHRITFYLRDVAKAFHAYYNKHRVLDDDPAVARARLYLVKAVQQAIRNGLALLGVSAPDRM